MVESIGLRGAECSGAGLVEQLQKLVGGELDLLVAPLGGPVVARNQARPMNAAKVPEDKGLSALGLVRRPIGEP